MKIKLPVSAAAVTCPVITGLMSAHRHVPAWLGARTPPTPHMTASHYAMFRPVAHGGGPECLHRKSRDRTDTGSKKSRL
jgi:hypothetical protein